MATVMLLLVGNGTAGSSIAGELYWVRRDLWWMQSYVDGDRDESEDVMSIWEYPLAYARFGVR